MLVAEQRKLSKQVKVIRLRALAERDWEKIITIKKRSTLQKN